MISIVRFLLLENKPLDAKLIQATLTDSGIDFEFVQVSSRAEFVTALETQAFDLILSAYALPGCEGITALETARTLRPDTPFIFVSASLGEELAIEALKQGATDYVLKQRLERLVPCVHRALREAQERRDLQAALRDRKQAEAALRQNEARLRTVAANLPNGVVFVVDHNLRYLLAEGNALQKAGMTSADLVGKTLWEALDPALATRYEPYYRQALSGKPFSLEHYSHDRYYITHGNPLHNEQGDVDAVLVVSYDISDRKRTESNAEFLINISQKLAEATSINEIVQTVGEHLNQYLKTSICTFVKIDEQIDEAVIEYDWHQVDVPSLVGVYPLPEFVSKEFLQTAKAGQTIIVCDVANDPRIVDRPRFAALNIGAFINVPYIRDCKWTFALGIYHSNPYAWRTDEIELMRELASRVWERLERIRAEVALRESEARLRFMLNASQIGAWDLDLTTQPYTAHRSLRHDQIFGYESLLPKWSYEIFLAHVHPDDRAAVNEKFQQTLSASTNWNFECRIIYLDQSIHWIWVRSSVYCDPNGKPTRLLGLVVDITDRKQSEVALRESEEQSRNILESVTDAFFALDRDWRFVYMNQSGEALLDRPPGDLIGKNFWEEFPGVTGSEFETIYRSAMDDCELGTLTAFYPDHDRWYDIRTYPAVNGITVYFNDISDLKQAEANLQQTSVELERQLQRFDAIATSVPDFIYTFDRSGRFTYSNQQLLNLLQKTSNEVLGKNFFDLDYPTELATRLQNQIQQVIETRQPLKDETPFASAFGDHVYEYIFVPLLGADGAVEGVAGVTRDITERKRLLQQEQTAREEAERANRLKDEFLAVLSHELRSPLNPILGWTRLLQNGKLDAARQTEALKTIERNAKLQSQLIEDLLDISRIMQGKLSLTSASVNLPFVISAAFETVRLAAEAKNIQVILDLDPKIIPISGDAARLQQVVWNLLTNAVKFTPDGGNVTVELRQLVSKGSSLCTRLAQIRVMDTGKGIIPSFLPHVFEYFRQEDGSTTRKFGGLGLGLAIVRQIVEMHGGTVKAESRGENQGATFIVQLPVMQQTAPIVAESPRAHAEAKMPLDNLQILLVDDEQDTREFQAFLLEHNGAKVTAVASGLEALRALDQFLPDAIVSDVGMAGMDGYMLIQQIRLRPAHQGGTIPAIALTAYAADTDQQKSRQAGFQTHITKPVEAEILVRAISRLCLHR